MIREPKPSTKKRKKHPKKGQKARTHDEHDGATHPEQETTEAKNTTVHGEQPKKRLKKKKRKVPVATEADVHATEADIAAIEAGEQPEQPQKTKQANGIHHGVVSIWVS